MNWLYTLFYESGVAHSVLLVAITTALGLALGRIKICKVSLGVTWILFVGILLSSMGLVLDDVTSHFVKEFGLILFIYSIGLQVGPGFFASFRKGGITYNLLAATLIGCGVLCTYIIHFVTGEEILPLIGVLYGAVTNTPGLGAAQQTYADLNGGASVPVLAQGYAVAYPLGVTGIILCIMLIKVIFKINFEKERNLFSENQQKNTSNLKAVTLEVKNEAVVGKSIAEIQKISGRSFVMSRILHRATNEVELAGGQSLLEWGDHLYLVGAPEDVENVHVLIGPYVENMQQSDWDKIDRNELKCCKIVLTNPKLNGKRLRDLDLNHAFHVTVTRVKRAGIDLIADSTILLQLGDRLNIVGKEEDVKKVQQMMGDSVKRLDEPHLMGVFMGIALGVLLGCIPLAIPGIPVPVKLGLAGGPLIVSILIARWGPELKIVTFTTSSANLLMRQIGICLFMASVGLGAGDGFLQTILQGGYWWVLYGFLITIIPCLLTGIIARTYCHLSYFTIAGIISGATTDPPALAYSNEICGGHESSVAYSTVYPLSMFLRVLMAQIMILIG